MQVASVLLHALNVCGTHEFLVGMQMMGALSRARICNSWWYACQKASFCTFRGISTFVCIFSCNQRANYKDKSCVTMYATTYPHLSTNEKIVKRYVPCTRIVRTAFCTCSFFMHHADARKPPSVLKYPCSVQASYMTFSHKFYSCDCTSSCNAIVTAQRADSF